MSRTSSSTGRAWGHLPVLRLRPRLQDWRSGTTPRAARSKPGLEPGSRSTAPTAITPTARREFGTGSAGVATQSHRLRHLQAAGGRRPRLRRQRIRHRPGPARQVDPGLSDRLDRCRHHDARAGQTARSQGRPGPGARVDRGHEQIPAKQPRSPDLCKPKRRQSPGRGVHDCTGLAAPGCSRRQSILDRARSGLERPSRGDASWWWQIEFPQPRDVGAILQVHGDHEYALRNAPSTYIWQASQDGKNWEDLTETATSKERRMYRIHRLDQSRRVRWLRLAIAAAEGDAPTLREVEFFERPDAEIPFPPWAVVVSTTGSNKVPGEGAAGFRRLARSCDGWDQLQFQNVWLGDFHEQFASARTAAAVRIPLRQFHRLVSAESRALAGNGRGLKGRAAAVVGLLWWSSRAGDSCGERGRSALGLSSVPRSRASPLADLHPYRGLDQAQVRRLFRLRVRTRTLHDSPVLPTTRCSAACRPSSA